MGDIIIATPESQPISLYLSLEAGRIADLEVVVKASLEFIAAIREVAFVIDPSLEVRIELENGEEGSLRLNAWLRQQRAALRREVERLPPLKTIAITAGTWFALQTGTIGYEAAVNAIFSSDDPQIVQLDPAEKEAIARRVLELSQQSAALEHAARFYSELHKDSAIKGVGLVNDHIAPPSNIVPRNQFPDRATLPKLHADVVSDVRKIDLSKNLLLTIIRPVLKEGGGKWRLSGPHGEFSASIEDPVFLNDILEGKADVPLAAEIRITVDLETASEKAEDGVWKPIGYRVLKVHSIERQPTQRKLFGSSE